VPSKVGKSSLWPWRVAWVTVFSVEEAPVFSEDSNFSDCSQLTDTVSCPWLPCTVVRGGDFVDHRAQLCQLVARHRNRMLGG
jgi:hypothetical protein